MVGPGSSGPVSGLLSRTTSAVISLLMLAMARGSSVPLVAQMPLADAPRYSSAPEMLIDEAPSGGSAMTAAAGTGTWGDCHVTTGALSGAVRAHPTYAPDAASTTAITIATTVRIRRRRNRDSASARPYTTSPW